MHTVTYRSVIETKNGPIFDQLCIIDDAGEIVDWGFSDIEEAADAAEELDS